MPTLKHTMIAEQLAELHQTFAPMDRGVTEPGYCRLSTRRGLCTRSQLDYIDAHTCPVCQGTLHENTAAHSDQAMFARSQNAKLAHEAVAQVPPITVVDPGPTIRLDGDAARFALNGRIAQEIAEEAARVDPARW